MVSVRKSPKAGSSEAGSPRPRAKRPATRVLVRWDDDKDKKLLLALQYSLNNKKIKIPWDNVARAMGPAYSGGAIVQHLAKVRKLRVEEGLEVPPPLTKGGRVVPAESKEDKKGSSNKRARLSKPLQDDDDVEDWEDLDLSNGSDYYDGGNRNGKRKPKSQGKSRSRAVTEKERTSGSTAGRKTRGSAAGSKATASGEDEYLQIEKRDSSPEGSPASSEQNYAVGDSMWDLDSDQDTEMEIKRSHSATPIEESENPSKVLVLNIGAAGFKKLGLARGLGKSKLDGHKAQKGKEMPLTLSIEDEEMGVNHYTDGADEELMSISNLANQSKAKKGVSNTGGHVILGEQQFGFVNPGSTSVDNMDLGGRNGSVPAGGKMTQATMHHDLNNQVDPFAYLAGHSYAGNQADSGMGSVNAGQGGYAVQNASFGNQTFNGYFPDMATPGQGPSASHAAFSEDQYGWSSQHANASSNGGYSYNQQVPAQMQQDNTFADFDFNGGNHFFGNPIENTAHHDQGYTTGFTDLQMAPAPFDPVLPTHWSPDFTANLGDLLNFD
ncbi:MAG: hypothetical protein L6R37_004006 [Teloschistes peruensis]|nr:MAG: hypothetical protein L6R37_004006 [Teloschistes peruensis]